MQLRTDLAIEAAAQLGDKDLPGVKQQTKQVGDIRLTNMVIEDEQGEKALGKPRGRYITAELPPLSDDEKSMEEKSVALGDELRALLPQNGTILVVGSATSRLPRRARAARRGWCSPPDIFREFSRSAGLENPGPTAVFIPGVLGQTGVESSEMVKGICEIVKPVAVIVIDAPPRAASQGWAAPSKSAIPESRRVRGGEQPHGAQPRHFRGYCDRAGVPTVVDARTVAVELTGRREAGTRLPRAAPR